MTDPSVSITRRAQPGEPVPGRRPGRARVRRGRAPSRCAPPCPLRGTRPAAGPRAGPAPPGRAGTGPYRRVARGRVSSPPPRRARADLTGRAEWRLDACGPGRQASPPRRPASGPAASTPGNGEGAHEVTARDHPAPAPAGLPLRQGRAAPPRPAAQLARGAFPLSPFPQAGRPGRRRPPPAGRGPDLTRRAERSVRRRGPTDGPPPGTPTAPGRPPATPDGEPGTPGDPLLTIEEVTAELRVSRAAFYRWRRQRAGPPVVRLPGGGVRVRRSALTAVAAPPGRRRDSRGARSRWTVTTSGSGTSRGSATAPQPGSGSGGPWTGASTASRSRPAPSPTGSSTA